MKRLLICIAAFAAAPAFAQTTLDITVPGSSVCSYITGPVTNGATSGHLQATATSSSGAGCGTGSSGNVTFGPALPLAPQTTTVQSGNSVSYSFQALNATTCSAVVTGAAPGSFTGGNPLCSGTGASTCSNRLVTASATFTNSGSSTVADTVTLTCTGTSGQAQSVATANVSPVGQPPPPGSCSKIVPSSGISGVASFSSQGPTTVRLGGTQIPTQVDMSTLASLFGTFPGLQGDIAVDILPVNNYISLQFKLPANFVENAPAAYYQQFSIGTSYDDTKAAMSISTSCGDFSNPVGDGGSTVIKNCWKNALHSETGVRFYAHGDPVSQCVLQDNVTYYLNIISADISGLTSSGGSAASYRDGTGSKCINKTSCSVPIENGPRVDYPGF